MTFATRRRLPDRRSAVTFELEAGGLRYRATIGHCEDDRVGEVFLTCNKADSAADTAARDSAVVASIALQFGAPLDVIRRALMRDAQGLASGPLGTALDLIARDPPPAEGACVQDPPPPTRGNEGAAAADPVTCDG